MHAHIEVHDDRATELPGLKTSKCVFKTLFCHKFAVKYCEARADADRAWQLEGFLKDWWLRPDSSVPLRASTSGFGLRLAKV